MPTAMAVASDTLLPAPPCEEDIDWGDEIKCGDQFPGFLPDNYECNAPNPPGALGNTDKCYKFPEYWKLYYYSYFKRVDEEGGKTMAARCGGGKGCELLNNTAHFEKVWTWGWERVSRKDVVQALRQGPPARIWGQPRAPRWPSACPNPVGQSSPCGAPVLQNAWIPADRFFAKTWEVTYKAIDEMDAEEIKNIFPNGRGQDCGPMFEQVGSRWIPINTIDDLPPLDSEYQPCSCECNCGSSKRARTCQGSYCLASSTKYPDFSRTLPF